MVLSCLISLLLWTEYICYPGTRWLWLFLLLIMDTIQHTSCYPTPLPYIYYARPCALLCSALLMPWVPVCGNGGGDVWTHGSRLMSSCLIGCLIDWLDNVVLTNLSLYISIYLFCFSLYLSLSIIYVLCIDCWPMNRTLVLFITNINIYFMPREHFYTTTDDVLFRCMVGICKTFCCNAVFIYYSCNQTNKHL